MREHELRADDIARVTAHVHQGAIDVLGPVIDPQTVHQAKFSMGTVLGLIAGRGAAGLARVRRRTCAMPTSSAFREQGPDGARSRGRRRLPERWIGKVTVETATAARSTAASTSRRAIRATRLSRAELEDKALRLAAFSGAATADEMRELCRRAWTLADAPTVGSLLAPAS